MKKYFLATAVVAGLSAASATQAGTIDFEEFNHGDYVSFVDLGGGVTAEVDGYSRTQNSLDKARIFDTTKSNTSDPDLEAPFNNGVNFGIETGNALIIQENKLGNPDDDGNGGYITFKFSQAITFLGFNFLDDEDVVLSDNNGNTVTVGPGPTTATNNFENFFSSSGDLNWANVESLRFDFGHNSGAIDNLRYEISVVPVPASLPLLLLGVGGLGFAARRRKRS